MVGRYETIGTVTTIPSPCLVLWDIDRTLLAVGTVSQELYAHGVKNIHFYTVSAVESVAEIARRLQQ